MKYKVQLYYQCQYETVVEAEDPERARVYAQAKLDEEDFDYEEFEGCEITELEDDDDI